MGASQIRVSGLAQIVLKSESPYDLFREWQGETRSFLTGSPNAFCLATVSKDMKVSARTLILRRLDSDGFVLATDKRSLKAQQLAEVASASMCFLWSYVNNRKENVTKQVRIDGVIKELPKEEYEEIYDKEPIFCKIRSLICPQGKEVKWDDLKKKHDEVLGEVTSGRLSLPMPDHFKGYKLYPTMMEFYDAQDQYIADRIVFTKDSQDAWKHHRIAA